jgi:anion-transporting  ArsA/GET3 family ATPase
LGLPGVSSVFSDGNSDCLWFINASTFGLFTFVGAAIFVYIYIPLKQTLKEQQKRIDEQKEMISKQAHLVVQRIQEEQHLKSSLKEKDKEIDSLHDIVINLEVRLEHQEQYSRRTSLRFHHIDVPVDDRGHISTNDISRSHVIGKVRNGKSQVIVRFLSYRCRSGLVSASITCTVIVFFCTGVFLVLTDALRPFSPTDVLRCLVCRVCCFEVAGRSSGLSGVRLLNSINSSVEASIKALMDEHIIPLKQTLKEQQKQIDEQKEMISKQAHLVVQLHQCYGIEDWSSWNIVPGVQDGLLNY